MHLDVASPELLLCIGSEWHRESRCEFSEFVQNLSALVTIQTFALTRQDAMMIGVAILALEFLMYCDSINCASSCDLDFAIRMSAARVRGAPSGGCTLQAQGGKSRQDIRFSKRGDVLPAPARRTLTDGHSSKHKRMGDGGTNFQFILLKEPREGLERITVDWSDHARPAATSI
jgi:hypothetical protein